MDRRLHQEEPPLFPQGPEKVRRLPAGAEWKATFYEDAPDTQFQTNPEAYTIRQATVKAGAKLPIKLAPGGGHCLMLSKY